MILREQDDLLKQHCSESQELTTAQALNEHLTAPFTESLEQAVEGLDRLGAQFVKHAADFDPGVCMGSRTPRI
jgi:hypothetical protein